MKTLMNQTYFSHSKTVDHLVNASRSLLFSEENNKRKNDNENNNNSEQLHTTNYMLGTIPNTESLALLSLYS